MTSQPKQLSRIGFFATAFTTGAIVMALEILGSRLLAPVFGNSLFVWGALIGVILAAMSSGYASGGWLADRYPGGRVLAWLLFGSGCWTLLLAGVGQPVLFTVSRWIDDPRWGPCLAAGVLLAVPAFGLSGVLPALLRLAIADIGHLGRHTGGMIAISTIGSLLGTWGTSFYLLTWLGTVTLVGSLGVLQVGLGISWWWSSGKKHAALATLSFAGAVSASWLAFHPILLQPPAVHEEDSPYQQVRVRDNDVLRFLILDNTFHAIMWKLDPVQLALPYSQMMMAVFGLHDEPRRGLILGHGGGSLAKWLARYWPTLELDVVEMDPSVVTAAEEYFDYHPPAHHHVFVQDARTFLRETPHRYDIVWMDAFARHLIPFHLTTQEFFAELRGKMDQHGVVAVNLASSDHPKDQKRAEAIVTTLKTGFPYVESFSVKGPSWLPTKEGSANVIFFAKAEAFAPMQGQVFQQRLLELLNAGKLSPEIVQVLYSSESPSWSSGSILTDDMSPPDLLQGSG